MLSMAGHSRSGDDDRQERILKISWIMAHDWETNGRRIEFATDCSSLPRSRLGPARSG